MNDRFAGKTLLITGGTDHCNAVLSRFIDSELREIRIFSRDEKQDEMRAQYSSQKVKYYIGDVRIAAQLSMQWMVLILCSMRQR